MNKQWCYQCGVKKPAAKPKPKAKAKAEAKPENSTHQKLKEEISTLTRLEAGCPGNCKHLTDAKAEAERRLAEHTEHMQSDVPLCYTEVQVNRNRRKEQAKLSKLEETLADLAKQKEAIEEKLKT